MRGGRLAILALLALATACAAPPPAPVEGPAAQAPAGFPADFYRQAAARGERVYRLGPERSEAVIYVYSAGRLARFGHDHVIASHDVQGYVHLPAGATGRADLYVALPGLSVDEPVLRTRAGFASEPSASDVAGTRRNMLDRVLEADAYPFAVLRIDQLSAGPSTPVLNVALTLHGVTRTLRVPMEVERIADDELRVAGAFSLRQSEFGMTPYSALGGALQVADRVDVRFRLRAIRLAGSGQVRSGR